MGVLRILLSEKALMLGQGERLLRLLLVVTRNALAAHEGFVILHVQCDAGVLFCRLE